MPDPGPVVVFDGYCVLCDGWVSFIIARDRAKRFRFAPLQGAAGQDMVLAAGLTVNPGESIVLCDSGRIYTKSTAALRILGILGPPWSFASILRLVPRFIRDAVYDVIARNRYRWFGRRDFCRIPTAEEESRFMME